jgi:hypothetical protein
MFDHAAAPWLLLRMPCDDDDDDEYLLDLPCRMKVYKS